jgi:hypothetical protein
MTTTVPPTAPVIPERYALHYSFSCCDNCGAQERHSELFALTFLRSRFRTGTVKHLTRCAAPTYNLPVDRVMTGTHRIALCGECPKLDLTHLPPPPSAAMLSDLPEPTAKSAKPVGAKAPAPRPSVFDLA